MRTASHPTEERGLMSGAQLAFKEHALKRAAEYRAEGKKGIVLHYHWEILTKVCYRIFTKTLKNQINLWKKGIRWPL